MKLLSRKQGRLLGMTKAGKELSLSGNELLSLHDTVVKKTIVTGKLTSIRLGIVNDIAPGYISRLLTHFSIHFPKITLDMSSGDSTQLLSNMKSRMIDIALIRQPPNNRVGDPLRKERLKWVGSPDIVCRNNGVVPLILFPEGCAYREQIIQALDREKIPWKAVFSSPDIATVEAGVLSKVGLVGLPESVIGNLPVHSLSSLPDLGYSELTLVTPKASKLSSALKDLISFIQNDFISYLQKDLDSHTSLEQIPAL